MSCNAVGSVYGVCMRAALLARGVGLLLTSWSLALAAGLQLVARSSAYVPAESFTLLAPQVVAPPPGRATGLQAQYDSFYAQVTACLEVRRLPAGCSQFIIMWPTADSLRSYTGITGVFG